MRGPDGPLGTSMSLPEAADVMPNGFCRRHSDKIVSGASDLVILGAGSTAFAAALRAQELGKTAVMAEEGTIGCT